MNGSLLGAGIAEGILSLPGDLPKQVMDEFRRGWRMEQILALRDQQEIAAAQPERTWMEGYGQVRLSITPTAYHYWGQRLGYKCWKDKQFLAEFERDNPQCRVKSVARKTSLRVQGLRPKVQSRVVAAPRGGIVAANRFGGLI